MSRKNNPRISLRLWRAFVLQIALISATAVVGVYLAEFAIREILIVSALQNEADYFWARRNIEGDTAAPNTHTFIGYVFDIDEPKTIPEEFINSSFCSEDFVIPRFTIFSRMGAGIFILS